MQTENQMTQEILTYFHKVEQVFHFPLLHPAINYQSVPFGQVTIENLL